MKRCSVITANDGDYKVKVAITFYSRNGLTRGEVSRATRRLTRLVAESVTQIPYADFGIENTAIKF